MARDLKEAVKMFKKIKDDLPNFYEDAVKEVGQRFLGIVIPLTPVEENYEYKVGEETVDVRGGALRRGWIGDTAPGDSPSPTEIEEYVRKLRTGGFKITIANSVSYAMYVNDGHRQKVGQFVPAIGKKLTKPWVDGLFFKEKAENQIEPELSRIYDSVLARYVEKWNKQS